MTSDTSSRLVKGGLWLSLAGVIVNALQSLSTIIVAWYLSPDDYGLVAIAVTILTIINSISDMRLGEALIREKDPGADEVDTVWTLAMLRGLLLAFVLFIAAYPVADFYHDERLILVMHVLMLSPFLLGLENPWRFLQQRALSFNQEFIILVSQRLISFICTVAIAIVYENYWALIIGNVIFNFAGTAVSYLLVRYRPRFSVKAVRKILSFSVWLTLGQVINTLNWRIEYLLIGKFLGLPALGIYTLGSNLAQLPTAETMKPVKKVIYPGFAKVLNDPASQDDPTRIQGAYLRAQSTATAIALPIGVGFALVADPMVQLVLDERWYPVVFILQYLAAVFAFQTIGSLVVPLAMAKNHNKRLFIRHTQVFFVRLPIIVLGLWLWGMPGVVMARVVTGVIAIAVNMHLVRGFIGLSILAQLNSNARSLVGVLVMSATVISVSFSLSVDSSLLLKLSLEVCAGIVSYCGTNLLLWRLMGCPRGPETELGHHLRSVLHATIQRPRKQ